MPLTKAKEARFLRRNRVFCYPGPGTLAFADIHSENDADDRGSVVVAFMARLPWARLPWG